MKSVQLTAYKAFQKALTNARLAAGLTQLELAAAIGKGQSFVSKVEAGDSRLDVLEYVRWMQALKTDPALLITALAEDLERSRYPRALVAESPSKPRKRVKILD